MLLQQQFTVTAPPPTVWAFFRDVPAVAACLPGVEEVTPVGPGVYQGALQVRVGPLGFRLVGKLVEQEVDAANRSATLQVTAEDPRLASAVNASVRLRLSAVGDGTLVTLDTEANVLGKLGQFGQGVIKLTADGVLKQFAACLQKRLSACDAERP